MPIQPLETRGHIGEKNLPKPPTTKLPNHPTPVPLFLVLSAQRLLMLVLSPSWQRLTWVQMGEKPWWFLRVSTKETKETTVPYHQSGCWYLWITYKGWWKNHYMDAKKHRLCWSHDEKSFKYWWIADSQTNIETNERHDEKRLPARRLTNIPPWEV